MMILKQKKVKMANEDTTTRRKPDSTPVIYLTAVKVAQCRELDANRREKEEAKKVKAKKTATRKVHIQLNSSSLDGTSSLHDLDHLSGYCTPFFD